MCVPAGPLEQSQMPPKCGRPGQKPRFLAIFGGILLIPAKAECLLYTAQCSETLAKPAEIPISRMQGKRLWAVLPPKRLPRHRSGQCAPCALHSTDRAADGRVSVEVRGRPLMAQAGGQEGR